MREMRRLLTTSCIRSALEPGVAESASTRKPAERRPSSRAACTYEWLLVALCASSTTRHTTSSPGQTPVLRSLTNVCAVRKRKRAKRHTLRRSSAAICPVSSAQSSRGRPTDLRTAPTCWCTSGLVGARKTHRPAGNQREKLYITAAAMSVLPIPVGRQTSVLCSSAVFVIECWYGRTGMLVGYTQLAAAASSTGTGGGRSAPSASSAGISAASSGPMPRHSKRPARTAAASGWPSLRTGPELAACGCRRG
mmetsp:Transcript_48641/g.154100  ORF Transcript_48641/g.154100 Transcript_48641/m.154100 type:complete len:251 (+) Transcript_48641:1095-1847(+)